MDEEHKDPRASDNKVIGRRLRMMIAGSIAVWVPVASAADAAPTLVDTGKCYRLKAEATADNVRTRTAEGYEI